MEAINSLPSLTRSDCARARHGLPPCRNTVDLTLLLRSFPGAAPVPKASPYGGEHDGVIGLLNRRLNNENRREEALRILVEFRRLWQRLASNQV
jgi:hypothetical protein